MRALLATVVLAAVAAPAWALTVDDLQPGPTVHGPALTAADMKGKVVFVEYTGAR